MSNQKSKENKYKQLGIVERGQMISLKEMGYKQKEIAEYIGYNQSTVSRELRRNAIEEKNGREKYKAEEAEKKYKDRRRKANNNHKKLLKNKGLSGLISRLLEEGHSPDVIANRILKEETRYEISTTTIYNYISKNIIWRRKCRHKNGYKKRSGKVDRRGEKEGVMVIGERLESINNREGDYDWEGDSVVGSGLGGRTTLTNRKHRYVLCMKAERLSGSETKYNIKIMLEGHRIRSITTDRGSEFSKLGELQKEMGVLCYVCDAYSSWQKGSNERNNREIRQYIPKGSSIKDYSEEDIKRIQEKINKKPRKILGYLSSHESYYGVKLTYLH